MVVVAVVASAAGSPTVFLAATPRPRRGPPATLASAPPPSPCCGCRHSGWGCLWGRSCHQGRGGIVGASPLGNTTAFSDLRHRGVDRGGVVGGQLPALACRQHPAAAAATGAAALSSLSSSSSSLPLSASAAPAATGKIACSLLFPFLQHTKQGVQGWAGLLQLAAARPRPRLARLARLARLGGSRSTRRWRWRRRRRLRRGHVLARITIARVRGHRLCSICSGMGMFLPLVRWCFCIRVLRRPRCAVTVLLAEGRRQKEAMTVGLVDSVLARREPTWLGDDGGAEAALDE